MPDERDGGPRLNVYTYSLDIAANSREEAERLAGKLQRQHRLGKASVGITGINRLSDPSNLPKEAIPTQLPFNRLPNSQPPRYAAHVELEALKILTRDRILKQIEAIPGVVDARSISEEIAESQRQDARIQELEDALAPYISLQDALRLNDVDPQVLARAFFELHRERLRTQLLDVLPLAENNQQNDQLALFSTQQAAQTLGIHPDTVGKLSKKRGLVPQYRGNTRFYSQSDLVELNTSLKKGNRQPNSTLIP